MSSSTDIVLISMPWDRIDVPPLALGILHAVLDREGIRCMVRPYQLDFVDLCITSPVDAGEQQLEVPDYVKIMGQPDPSLAEWVFAVPPLNDVSRKNAEELFSHLRSTGVSQEDIDLAARFRRFVQEFLDRCVEDVLSLDPRVVGFTTYGVLTPTLVLSKLLKQQEPSLKVIVGGACCFGPMGAAMHRAFPWIDLVVRGEGEPVLPGLVREMLAGRPVTPRPGLCYRNDGASVAVPEVHNQVVMDEIPTPIFDDYFERLATMSFGEELENEGTIRVESARGCWWAERSQCRFCGIQAEASKYRSKSPKRVADEIRELARKYQRLDYDFINYVMDSRSSMELLEEIGGIEADHQYYMLIRPNTTKEQLIAMKRAGVTAVRCGLESLSTPILKQIRKGTTALNNIRLLRWCAELDMRIVWNLIYGFPGEPIEEYERMAKLMESLSHLQPPKLIKLQLDRFSPYFQSPDQYGLECLGPLPYYRLLLPCIGEDNLQELSYSFAYRHLDCRDPEDHVRSLRNVISSWRNVHLESPGSLTFRKGLGFTLIEDKRPSTTGGTYMLGELEGLVYSLCADGSTVRGISSELCLSTDEISVFLKGIAGQDLIVESDGLYLALATQSLPLISQ
jgi:ribosomal peptide maturation radical SAM protein 1